MKIKRVEATFLKNVAIRPPPFLPEPARKDAIVVEVETDDGHIGYALGAEKGAAAVTLGYINQHLAQRLNGRNAALVEEIWNDLTRDVENQSLMRAIGAIDVCLWDLRGKASGLPVWRLLGGARGAVRVYITFGATGPNTGHAYAPAYTLEQLVEEARYHTANGQRALKAGVGRFDLADVDADYARMAAIREAVGPGVALMMDARCRLSLEDAIRLCRLCEPLDIRFFEDPVLMNDPRLLAELAGHTTIPLAANAEGADRWAYRELLASNAIQIAQMNAAKIGFTEAVAIAQIAHAFNRTIANGNGSGPHNAQFQGGMRNGSIVEYHYNIWMLYEAVFKSVVQPRDGWLHLPETPGMGLDVRPEVIKEYRAVPG